jgi:hypothetical protein
LTTEVRIGVIVEKTCRKSKQRQLSFKENLSSVEKAIAGGRRKASLGEALTHGKNS